MKIFSSLHLLAALGALGAAAGASAQVDTSQWKCTSCPYPKGTTGSVDAGLGYVTDSSKKFGDYTGLDEKGAFLDLGGNVSYRGENGYFADLWGADLGLDSRRLYGQAGREGLYSLNVGYAEIPRHLTDGASTPFFGFGSSLLTLPPGFPAADTASMPLAGTLQPVDIGFKYKRLDLGGTFIGEKGWSANLSLRHDERDGTRPVSGSFLSTASQFVAPVNEKTDGAELTIAYATKQLQATVSYMFSSFRNDDTGVTWSNPFFPAVPGATSGQLGLAPDNQFQQLRGTAAYDITPTIRISGEAAFGRMTQNDGFLAPTVNTILAPTVPPLPANSLDGQDRHVHREHQDDGGADSGPARDGKLRPRQPRQQDAGSQLSDRHDRHGRRHDAAQQHAIQLHARPVQADRRLQRRPAEQHAPHRRRRVRHARAHLPGGRDDARNDALGQVHRAADREAVGMAEVRVLVARQLRLWNVVLVRLPGKSAAAQVLPGRPPAQHARGPARLRDQREDLARRLGRLCGRRLQPVLGRPHLGAQRQCRRRARDAYSPNGPRAARTSRPSRSGRSRAAARRSPRPTGPGA